MKGTPGCWITLLVYLIYEVSAPRREGPKKWVSEWVCLCFKARKKEGGRVWGRNNRSWREGKDCRDWTTRSRQCWVTEALCLEESEVALGLLLLPRASGEAAPGSPGGTEAIAWDTVLAAKLWPSNKPNTTRVSPRPDAQHLTAVMNISLTSFNWGTNLAARGYHVG